MLVLIYFVGKTCRDFVDVVVHLLAHLPERNVLGYGIDYMLGRYELVALDAGNFEGTFKCIYYKIFLTHYYSAGSTFITNGKPRFRAMDVAFRCFERAMS